MRLVYRPHGEVWCLWGRECYFHICFLQTHMPSYSSQEEAVEALVSRMFVYAQAWIARDNIFQEDKQAQQASRSVMAFVRNSVSGRIDEIVAAALRNKAMISRAVGEILGKDCSAFAWQQRECSGHMTASFEAVSDDHLYSMNLMTGTVLLDGLPLGRLPNEVVQNSLYKSVFGGINFEVNLASQKIWNQWLDMANSCQSRTVFLRTIFQVFSVESKVRIR